MAKLVYTTGGAPPAEPERGEERLSPERHAVVVRIERSGRGGKTVTVASPFHLPRAEAAALSAEMKRSVGGGGAMREGTTPGGKPCFVLEVQGDHVGRVVALLVARGFRAKPGR